MTDKNKSKSKRIRSSIYGDRITVSLRLNPDLHRRMMALCTEKRIPANAFISDLISDALMKQER